MTAASSLAGVGQRSSASTGITAAASPFQFPASTAEFGALGASTSDPTLLLAASLPLFGLAAGVRRHSG